METKKVLSIIFSILFIGAFAFVLSWGIINFNKVQDGLSGTGVYTKEDVDNAYKDGYSTALDNEKEYTELIDSYRDTITSQTDELSKLNNQVFTLTSSNKDYTNQIANLTEQKNSLEEQVDNLSVIKNSNESTINDLTSQILILQKEVSDLQNSNYNKSQEIAQKNSQISNLQNSVNQLQKTNELNVETITNLNNQIASLNTQITDMTLQIQNNSTNVTALNIKIAELEKSVAYYEQYIANLENGGQVVATFEFNGSVYNIQIVNKNDIVSVVNPTSTDYVIFNHWTVNGEQIDLSTYQITTNTKIVANVTLKYDVKFMVVETEYNSQLVIKNGYATMPENPTKDGYEFDGWTINGVDVIDPTTIEITNKTTFIAKFTKLHTVTFMYEDTTFTTQTIRNNEYSSNVTVDSTTYKVFNGWKLNGAVVDVASQKIVADTTFVADIIYKYDVTFIVDDTEYANQIVTLNDYATIPDTPTKSGYRFNGWSVNGVGVADVASYNITSNTQFIAVFIEQIGFDSITYTNDSLKSQPARYKCVNYKDYVISYSSNILYFLNTNTNLVESYNFVSVYDLYIYDDYIYATSDSTMYRFNILDKTYETVFTSSESSIYEGGNRIVTYIYNDIVYLFGYSSTTYNATMRYSTYNLNTKTFSQYVSLNVSGNYDSFPSYNYSIYRLNNNLYFIISCNGEKYHLCSFDLINVNASTIEIDKTTFGISYSVFVYKDNIYINAKSGIYLFNESVHSLTLTDCPLSGAGVFEPFVLDDILFVKYFDTVTRNYKLYIYDFDDNSCVELSDSPFTEHYLVLHCSDNKYIIYGKVGSSYQYVYYWIEE